MIIAFALPTEVNAVSKRGWETVDEAGWLLKMGRLVGAGKGIHPH